MIPNIETFTCSQYSFSHLSTTYQQEKRFYLDQSVLFFQFTTSESAKYPILPDGCIDFIFCCDPAHPHAHIAGSVTAIKSTYIRPYTEYFGVRLSPMLSTHVAQYPSRDLLAQEVQLELIFPSYRFLLEKIIEERNFRARITHFETHCSSLLFREKNARSLVDFSITYMLEKQGNLMIQDLSSFTAYSTRYVRQKFEDTLGLSPKQLLRILRFQHSLHDLKKIAISTSFSDMATHYGYTDQSHFIKDFKQFSSLTPLQMSKIIQS